MDEFSLNGRVAVVTGGSRGIGRAITTALARRGASVAICYRAREDAARETIALVKQHGANAYAAPCDVTDEASVTTFFEQVRSELGPIDILFYNAGIVRYVLIVFMSRGVWIGDLETDMF